MVPRGQFTKRAQRCTEKSVKFFLVLIEFIRMQNYNFFLNIFFSFMNIGGAKAIEADVIIGFHEGGQNDENIPIMGHPPAVKSDLSLVEFLEAIKEYHSKPENANQTKIVKLDFKSIEATERSIEMLEKDWKKVSRKFRKKARPDMVSFDSYLFWFLFHSVYIPDLGKCWYTWWPRWYSNTCRCSTFHNCSQKIGKSYIVNWLDNRLVSGVNCILHTWPYKCND